MGSYTSCSVPNTGVVAFRAYPADQAIGIIRAIAEHRWPMTVEEAFSLRDQFGWTPAPDDGRFFVTPSAMEKKTEQ